MDFPNITLQMENNRVRINLNTDADTVTQVWEMDKGLDVILFELAKAVQCKTQDLSELMRMIREGDEKFLEFATVEPDTEKFSADVIIEQVKAACLNYSPESVGNKSVDAELRGYWQADVLASALEEIYNHLIVRTIFTASEVGTGNIVLDDARREARLREKFSKELAEVAGIELIVV